MIRVDILKAGILYQNINVCGGRELVTVAILSCLNKLNVSTVLFTGKKTNKSTIRKHFGLDVHVAEEIVLPMWNRVTQTYFNFCLPLIARPLCDLIINPLSSDLLPWVDVTYVHYPNPLIINEKMKKSKFWNFYYQPYQKLQKVFARNFSGKLIIANSFFTAKAVRKQFNLSPIVIYPPVDVNCFDSSSTSKKEDMILTISRFSFEKGLEKIPRMAEKVNGHFVIVGSVYSSKAYQHVRRLIADYGVEDKVSLVPNASLELKIQLLQRAKVYLHTTVREHFGISIIEGMAAGCIPVVHNSGGPQEFVSSEWRYDDEEEGIQKIQNALCKWSPAIAEEMKANSNEFGINIFEQKFSNALESFFK